MEVIDLSQIITLLSDENRITIFIYLLVNKKVTLKQLSDQLGKGKTTVHHHIKKLEKENIVVWEEEESRRKLKTRYYSINTEYLQKCFTIEEIENNEISGK